MSKSWIRTILLMSLAVLCLVGAIVMKSCSLDDAVDASYTEVDSSSAANSDTGADSAVVDDSSSDRTTEIKVVFSDEEDDSASAIEEQDESKAAEQASSEEDIPAAPTSAVTSETVAPQPTKEPTVVITPVPTPESTAVPVPEPTPEPTVEPTAEPTPLPPASEIELEQNTGYADNGWQPEAVEHYHGNGSDSGTCPACGLIYGPAGGAEGQYGEQDGLMD